MKVNTQIFFNSLAGLIICVIAGQAMSQTTKVLYNFAGGTDGANPWAGVIFDSKGNLYGTTNDGGTCGCGDVFELTPTSGGGWTESVLYTLTGGSNSWYPYAALVVDSAGNLYGASGFGSVFELHPTSSGTWQEKDLLIACCDLQAALVPDPTHHGFYGTNSLTVFKLTQGAGGAWTNTVLFTFNSDGSNGSSPRSPLLLDSFGNIYGTTTQYNTRYNGNVFKLTRSASGVWNETVLYNFQGASDGYLPWGNIVFDKAGNLYGATTFGGTGDVGTVFKLSPVAGGGWTKSTIYSFAGGNDGAFPVSGLTFGTDGNLYGTTQFGGGLGTCQTGGCGTVFKLTPPASKGKPWTETILHSFAGGTDGATPDGAILFDAAGNLYGTTYSGGMFGFGMVFEITP